MLHGRMDELLVGRCSATEGHPPDCGWLDGGRNVRDMPRPFPRTLIRKIETDHLPLQALQAVRDLRRYLDMVEETAILRARELGASPADIAHALGITRQGVYHKLRMIESRVQHRR